MEIAAGFFIALAIAITGVGGGVLTAPVLILCLGMPVPQAVATALAFVVVVKSVALPVYVSRGQVAWRTLAWMLAGGVPGALAGSALLWRASGASSAVLAVVGFTVVLSAGMSLVRLMRQPKRLAGTDRPGLLSLAAGAIGMEVGFSSAGAGALGTIALFQWSSLAPAAVVGTDLMFGFVLSLVAGGFHLLTGSLDSAVLLRLAGGGVVGALAGAWLAPVFPARALRAAISLALLLAGTQLSWRGVGALLATR